MNADDLAQSLRDRHSKIEADCKQTVLAVELLTLQVAVRMLTDRVSKLERKQSQDADNHEKRTR